MQPSLRGEIEKFIDNLLHEEKVLPAALAFFEKALEPTVRNTEDALFGYVYGRAIQFLGDLIMVKEQRRANMDELNEVFEVFRRRALEIKSEIRLLVNR